MAYEHPGFMFMCTKATEIDCLGRKLLGLPKGSYKDMLAVGNVRMVNMVICSVQLSLPLIAFLALKPTPLAGMYETSF